MQSAVNTDAVDLTSTVQDFDAEATADPHLGLRLGFHRSMDGLEALWRPLEDASDASVFQSWTWLRAWCATAAPARSEHPFIVTGHDAAGRLVFLLPLGISRRLGLNMITWLGQSHATYGMPLIDRRRAGVDRRMIATAIRVAAQRSGAAALQLAHQPDDWGGAAWSDLLGPGQREANDSFVLELEDDWDRAYERLFSTRTRSSLRRKERRLLHDGSGYYKRATTSDERLSLLDIFFTQKREQLALAGSDNVFEAPEIKAFYRHLAGARRDPNGLEIDALVSGGEVAALVLSMRHGDRVYMLNTSITPGPLRDLSPGKLLIHRHVTSSREAGARRYDFGPGEAAYKREWEPRAIGLVTSSMALTLPGAALSGLATASEAAKRTIKRTPLLWRLAVAARRRLAGKG